MYKKCVYTEKWKYYCSAAVYQINTSSLWILRFLLLAFLLFYCLRTSYTHILYLIKSPHFLPGNFFPLPLPLLPSNSVDSFINPLSPFGSEVIYGSTGNLLAFFFPFNQFLESHGKTNLVVRLTLNTKSKTPPLIRKPEAQSFAVPHCSSMETQGFLAYTLSYLIVLLSTSPPTMYDMENLNGNII